MTQRLFLTSVGLSALPKFVLKPLTDLKVGFIPTAADPYEDKWFVDIDRKKLQEFGVKLIEIDLKNTNKNALRTKLNDIDMIYVAGGNTFYLLEKMQESGFDELIKEYVQKGVIYVGASAGAVVVCPTIEPLQDLDDPSKASHLISYNALNLIDFIVLSHYGKEKYKEKYEKLVNTYKNKGYKIIGLRDDQAIVVNGLQYDVIDSE